MGFVIRILWAVACGVVAWLVCHFLGGLLATAGQPQLDYTGAFLVANANVIAILVIILAFVFGAPTRVTALVSHL
jgi:hypothetical protein